MRFRNCGHHFEWLRSGPLNRITDVEGLGVGHYTLVEDFPRILRTGVTAIRIEDVIRKPLMAASSVFNGYGKSMGLIQIDELGTLESHIYLTNTLSIGAVHQAAIKIALDEYPDLTSHNAIVMECNDSYLNDITALAVSESMAVEAYKNAARDFELGSVGVGTGMVCFDMKGGIGSASRVGVIDGREYTVGSLVLSNFGSRQDLRIEGFDLKQGESLNLAGGSLIMIVATDIPLLPHHLKRVARHMSLAIGILGAPGYHGSGDISLAFSTARTFDFDTLRIGDSSSNMNLIFRMAVQATTEAILDSMFCSKTMSGLKGTVKSIHETISRK